MSSKKIWFITGAGRGMGVDIAKAIIPDDRALFGVDVLAYRGL